MHEIITRGMFFPVRIHSAAEELIAALELETESWTLS